MRFDDFYYDPDLQDLNADTSLSGIKSDFVFQIFSRIFLTIFFRIFPILFSNFFPPKSIISRFFLLLIFNMIRIYFTGFERGHIIIRNYPGWKPFKRCSGHRPLPFNWRIFPGFVTKRRWNWTQSFIFGRFAIFYRFYW